MAEARAERANQALAEAESRMQTITRMCGEIARAVEEQSDACRMISSSMDAIGTAHQTNVAHSKASHDAALSVDGQAKELRTLARQFWDRRTAESAFL